MGLAETVAANLQRARLVRGWSQETLAKRCVPRTVQQQIDKLESGERRLTLEWVERLAHALELHPLQLFIADKQSPAFHQAASRDGGGANKSIVSNAPASQQQVLQGQRR